MAIAFAWRMGVMPHSSARKFHTSADLLSSSASDNPVQISDQNAEDAESHLCFQGSGRQGESN